jgi:hypothetical protein
MFIIAVIGMGLALTALFCLIGCGIYISVMEPESPREHLWQQDDMRKRPGAQILPNRRQEMDMDLDGRFTRAPHA